MTKAKDEMKAIATVTVNALDYTQPSVNGYVYTKEVLQEAIDKAQEKIDKGEMLCPLDPAPFGEPVSPPTLTGASHRITSLALKEGKLQAELQVLDTPQGKTLQELLDIDAVEFKPIGLGTVSEDGKEVEDYKLLSIAVYCKEKK